MTDSDELPTIDRMHSVPLDVHKWSDHSEIKGLSDRLYSDCNIIGLDQSGGNKKAKRTAQDMLRVLLLDLYVNWLKDPALAISISRNKNDYRVKGNRYNQLHISPKIIDVLDRFIDHGFVEQLDGYNNRNGPGQSFQARIRHTVKLRKEFQGLVVGLHDIEFDRQREVIILREKFTDDDGTEVKSNLDYQDTDYSNEIRRQLADYNELLKRTFIDIPHLKEPYVERNVGFGRAQRISISVDNKHVHRVFNGTEADNWSKGGRFYGGWWQQIPRDLRKDILIDDKQTVEVDYKALHPNLLLLEAGEKATVVDPYDLGALVLSDLINNKEVQRSYVKKLVLMAINASSAKSAYQAFRNSMRSDDTAKHLKNNKLKVLLDAFIDKFPMLKDKLNTGQALHLMEQDSRIANMVIDRFTKKDVPILCIHDSFIIQQDKEQELQTIMRDAIGQVAKGGVSVDVKSNKDVLAVEVEGNIPGYEEPREIELLVPKTINRSDQYKLRQQKFDNFRSHISAD